ncbi:uncharacterized protein TNCV_2366251 [Trichonephila clavipes]|nr:uncharacterized protein TNCV_2366251 [Trichonephila clavipes]
MKRLRRVRPPVPTTRLMVFCSRQCLPSDSKYRQTVSGKKGDGAQIKRPPFSPDLNPPGFFLFRRLKFALKGKRFDDISDIQENVTRLLNSILKVNFLQSFRNMYSRSQQCIVIRGNYFEGQ